MSDVHDFGAVGDGKMDDTEALQHALDDGDGVLTLPRGTYRITKPLLVDLARHSRRAIHGSGGVAKLVMAGPGPAIVLKGTHSTTADPTGFRPEEWVNERMPTVSNLEIEGDHPEADGIRIIGVMQPTLTGVLIRHVRTAVHITDRARNVLISHCHIYHNTGIGVHLEKVNLHQVIITGSHISYCRLGGIRTEKSEIRNFQITGNDIEYNNNRSIKVPEADDVPTAEIYLDVREGSVREGTICSNTIQATYSPNGANIRFLGADDTNHKVGMWTISGNLIGSQQDNIWLTSTRGITISGNYIYSGHRRNLLVENSRNIVVGANCFGHNPDYGDDELCTGVRFIDSEDCVLNGLLIQDCRTGQHTVPGSVPLDRQGLVELLNCRRITISGCHIIGGTPYGLFLKDCTETVLSGCSILDDREENRFKAALHWEGSSTGSLISGSHFAKGTEAAIQVEDAKILQGNRADS